MSVTSIPKSVAGTESPVQFPKLECTPNDLKDIVDMIQTGNIVAFYIAKDVCRVFHNLDKVDLSQSRVVYLDCYSRVSLFQEGEWEPYLHQMLPNLKELDETDALREKIIQQDVPYKKHFRL